MEPHSKPRMEAQTLSLIVFVQHVVGELTLLAQPVVVKWLFKETWWWRRPLWVWCCLLWNCSSISLICSEEFSQRHLSSLLPCWSRSKWWYAFSRHSFPLLYFCRIFSWW